MEKTSLVLELVNSLVSTRWSWQMTHIMLHVRLCLCWGARWIDEGEKITNYFFGLEKRNYINKTNDLKLTLSNAEEMHETI